ncbi:MAG: hypothetical protein ACI84C_002588 [Flavobacteriales bacterium]|jgi:hypothetical protein
MIKFSKLKNSAIILVCSILSVGLSGQLVIEPNGEPEALIQEFLLGSGVVIDNISFSGDWLQLGQFDGAEDIVGMESGLILSTAGVLGSMTGGEMPIGNAIDGDDDLMILANTVPALIGQGFYIYEVFDVASLEFDFIPLGDSLAFNFVFGSDEYMEWVNTNYNDVFGFFISGPGITGPYQAPEDFPNGAANIAFIPESDPQLPITVSSVNAGINSDYYNDNQNNVDIFIDGYTDVITASANGLTVGETYHMRLAIADGSDNAFESIVMLEAGTFSSYLTVEPGSPGDFDGDGDLDVGDLLILIGEIGCTGEDCVGDLNGDGIVNVLDILDFLGLF